MKLSKKSPLLLALGFFLTTLVFAQNDNAQSPAPWGKLSEEIVVTASAEPETVETAPAAVTVITREEFEQRDARDIADVLRDVPGLTISRSGSAGKATSLFTRGANSTHTLVLWNGIEINNPYFAGYDWGRFSTEAVEQVEVVRGPYSALYGSDAVAGVINVLTTPRSSYVNGQFASGSHGFRNMAIGGAWVGQQLLASGSYEHRTDQGWSRNDDFRQNGANGQLKWTTAGHFSLGLLGRYTSYDLGIPYDINSDFTALVPSLQRRQNGSERQMAIPIEQTLGRFSYDLTLSESRRADDFIDPQDPFGTTSSSTASRTRRGRLSGRLETAVGTLIGGGEVERAIVDDASNQGVNLRADHRSASSLFLEDRYSHELASGARLELSLGARHDRFDTFGSQTSPRFAGAWIVGREKIRAGYGRSFRAPSVGELYFPFAGNRNLQPESASSYEIGYDHATGPTGLLSVTLFSGRYRDLIVFDNATYAFQNVGRARTRGVELGSRGNLSPTVFLNVSYTYLHTEENGTGEPLLRRPKHSGSVSLTRHAGRLEVTLVGSRTGSRADVLPVFPYSRVINDAFTTYDADFRWRMSSFTPFVKLENLTDARYEEVRGYPAPGRRAVLGLRFAVR